MQLDKSCSIVEQYLAYLITIKGRSKNTVLEYRLDLLQFLNMLQLLSGCLLTPAVKQSLSQWLSARTAMSINTDA